MAYNNTDLVILGEKIALGQSKTINFSFAKLYTSSKVEIPVIIQRAKTPGPTVLITAGIHGDEINGVEIVRQIIARKINIPLSGTTICIPILNTFGFLNADRTFPDGRDLNRVFPGTKTGSLASRVATLLANDPGHWPAEWLIILPKKYCPLQIIVWIFIREVHSALTLLRYASLQRNLSF